VLPGEPFGSVVGGEFWGAEKGDGCAVLFGDFGDLGVVGGDDDFGNFRHAKGEFDGMGDERFPGERANVFTGDAFGAATGEDESVGDGHGIVRMGGRRRRVGWCETLCGSQRTRCGLRNQGSCRAK